MPITTSLRQGALSCPTRLSWTTVILLVGFLCQPAAGQDADTPEPSRVTVTTGMDVANAYVFRGIRQDDTGTIMWPALDVGLTLFSGDERLRSATVNLGVWNSLHTGSSGTDGPRAKLWYEGDFYASLSLWFSNSLGVSTIYTAYASPNGMFSTVKELAFRAALDDSRMLRKAALHPYALVAIELGAEPGRGQADGGLGGGRYLELGVAPAWAASPIVSVTFPVKLALSLSNYYEGPTGDEIAGYLSVGATATHPLKKIPAAYGTWNVHGGLEFLKLGDTGRTFNLGKDRKVIVSGGFTVSY